MSSSEEKQQMIEATTHNQSKRTKVFLTTVASLLIAAVVLCVLVAVLTTASNSADSPMASSEDTENVGLANEVTPIDDAVPGSRSKRFVIPEGYVPTSPSCFSEISNTTIPSAHIKGKGRKFTKHTQDSSTAAVKPGYQQRWQCTELPTRFIPPAVHAFVEGGMYFNQTDQTLRVPVCGYYTVSSQILFSMHKPLNESVTVHHTMKIDRNCNYSSNIIAVMGKSTIGPFSVYNHQAGVATSFTSDIVKLCEGGSVWIEIADGPNGPPCCPSGEGSFMTAALVSETDCHWPPTVTIKYLDP